MVKRSSTGYSFVVGIDKPAGMSSHDIVNRCRRIYGERRIGHTGTLDPAATGALIICVGPATRLDRFLTAHDKTYEFSVVFGTATDTDDAEGQVTKTLAVPSQAYDELHAREVVAGLVGKHKQLPPVYSAIKVNGKKAYEEARRGNIIELQPRDIEIYDAQLIGFELCGDVPVWHVRASVSAGTYIRSIARDWGSSMGTCAHVGFLRRTCTGLLDVESCVSLEALERDPFGSLLDPVKLMERRFVFARGSLQRDVECGRPLPVADLPLFAYDTKVRQQMALCGCTSGVHPADGPLFDGEEVCIVVGDTLKAMYSYDAASDSLKSCCGFAVGVKRGSDI